MSMVWVHDSTGDYRSEHGGSGTWHGAFLCKMDKGSRHNSSLPLSGRPARCPDKRCTICVYQLIDHRYIHSTRAVGKKSPILYVGDLILKSSLLEILLGPIQTTSQPHMGDCSEIHHHLHPPHQQLEGGCQHEHGKCVGG